MLVVGTQINNNNNKILATSLDHGLPPSAFSAHPALPNRLEELYLFVELVTTVRVPKISLAGKTGKATVDGRSALSISEEKKRAIRRKQKEERESMSPSRRGTVWVSTELVLS